MMIKDEGPSTKLILVLELLDVFPASWELDLWGGAWNPTESAILLFSLTFCHSAREPESIVPLNITILNQPACLTIHQRGLPSPCALPGGGVVPGIIQNGSHGLCGGLQPLQGVWGTPLRKSGDTMAWVELITIENYLTQYLQTERGSAKTPIYYRSSYVYNSFYQGGSKSPTNPD